MVPPDARDQPILRNCDSDVTITTTIPHFHVRYSGQKALIGIEIWRSSEALSPRALSLVGEWAALHRAELTEDWNLARAEAELRPIAPLE
jgi:hypothetical protein